LDYLERQKAEQVPSSSALARNILLAADVYGDQPRILTANYGFDGYMGVPGLNGTDAAARDAAYAANVAWQDLDPGLNAPSRALYSAVGTSAFLAIYGVPALRADTIPVVFSHPVLPASVSPDAFRITLNTGETVTPITASFLPNLEYNERQTVVLSGYWGNRMAPGQSGALYPVRVDIVPTRTPMMLVTAGGLVPASGLGIESRNPYQTGNGPRIVAAQTQSVLQSGRRRPSIAAQLLRQQRRRPLWRTGEIPVTHLHQRRVLAGWHCELAADRLQPILPAQGTGSVRQGPSNSPRPAGPTRFPATVRCAFWGWPTPGSNKPVTTPPTWRTMTTSYDVILDGDLAAVERIYEIQMPSSGAYRAVYNPGGPGNHPAGNPPPGVPFTVASQDHRVALIGDLAGAALVSYVEIDGDVVRHPVTAQPVGRLLGPAVIDTRTGYSVKAYVDPAGRRFFASFPVNAAP
jgi:hypothetical protein